jgi:hypothetical protein
VDCRIFDIINWTGDSFEEELFAGVSYPYWYRIEVLVLSELITGR